MNEKKKKGFSPVALVLIFVFVMFAQGVVPVLLDGELGVGLIALIPVAILVVVVLAASRKKPQAHTHDRIDHKSDLKINPQTGKAERVPVKRAPQHSAREHWQQQLDGLLANGTIDRAEYRAMMNRKF